MQKTQPTDTSADILIVDDNIQNLRLLSDLLTSRGYNVRPTTNGEEALEAVKRRKPELFLLDIKMPGMDGFELCRRLKSDAQIQDTPIIFISGLEDAEDKARAFATGGVDYITKPIEEGEVLARVHTHLSLARTRDSLRKLTAELELRVQERTAELASSEERLAMVLEGSQQGFWDWDILTGNVQRNERWAQMLGYNSIKEFENSIDTWTDNIHPDDREAAWEAINDHLEDRTPSYELDYRMLTKSGEIKWIHDQAKIVQRDAEGRPLRMCGTHTDITERKRAEQEHERFQQQIMHAQKLESIGQLAAGVAHELNNGLAAVAGFTSLIKRTLSPDGSVSHYFAEIETGVERLKCLAKKLLTFSKGGAPVTEATDIGELLRETAASTLQNSNSACVFTIDDTLPFAEVDKFQFQLALKAFIDNASHAMPDGGTIIISAVTTHIDGKDLLPLVSGRYIKITIHDNGCGISEENIGKVFDPFFSTREGSEGMGLTTAYSIIKQHNGYIDVDSVIGEGSTFHIYLPVDTDDSIVTPYTS